MNQINTVPCCITKTITTLTLATLVILFGCSDLSDHHLRSRDSSHATQSSQTVNLTTNVSEADNGKTIAIKADSNLVITLPGNPSTGYSWSVTNVVSSGCLSGQSVEQQGQPVYTTTLVPGSPKAVGRGGFYRFTFKIPPLCVSTIELAYQQPWSKNRVATFKVTIKP